MKDMIPDFAKNKNFRLGLIFGILIISILAVMPRTPVIVDNEWVSFETSIGGYNLNFFNGRYQLDLTEFKKGLDLEGGIRILLEADMSDIESANRDSALESARQVIQRRVNYLGVSEPYIAPLKVGDSYRIIVEIPGVEDVASAVDLIGQTAQLKFKQLNSDAEWDPSKFEQYYRDPSVWENTDVTGADLRGVEIVYSQDGFRSQNPSGAPQIQLQFTPSGREEFSQLAKQNIGKPIALFLDEDSFPLSMPVVSEDLAEGVINDPVISGNFDAETANTLSVQIRAGALPVPVEILEQETVGATLGSDSVDQSFTAGVIGMALILLFMVLVYGKFGLVADFALILYTLLVLAIFKIIPVVLTLPGIAGFLLSVGMAVDANILIFERIREELEWGRPRSLAIKFGFERAWTSIRDSNVSSLLTAGILFYLGSGPIRGFALTLSIGILASLFSAIFVVRTMIEVFNFDKESKKMALLLKIPFMSKFVKKNL